MRPVEVGHRCGFDRRTRWQLRARPNPVIEGGRRNLTHRFITKLSEEVSPRVIGERKRTLFSRDLNYLRDMALFWPFVLYSIFGVASAFSPGYRHFAIRCALIAIAALILSKEKLLLFVVGTGFIAIQCSINLTVHAWSWGVFTAGILTALPFLMVSRYWPNRKLTYQPPREFRLLDALWSLASLIGTLLLGYVISPFR